VRVELDVNKPLTRLVGLHPEGSERLHFQVLYEKLPKFCEKCGLFGHGELECGDGVHSDDDKQYGRMETGCVPQSMTGIHKHRVCESELLEGKLAREAEEGAGRRETIGLSQAPAGGISECRGEGKPGRASGS
jgi:hypothetical protein